MIRSKAHHLGNVRAVVSANSSGVAETVSYTDYYPHGGTLPGRNYQSSLNFPYGYQGQEKDAATGLTNFELRQYDPRIGRRYNPDPYMQHHSPYLAMSNNPISFTDPDGGWDWDGSPEPVDDPGNPEKTKGPVQVYTDQAIGNGIYDRYNTGWGTDVGDGWIQRMEYQANRGADIHRRNELKGRYSGVGQFVKKYSYSDGSSYSEFNGFYGDLGNGKKEAISAQDVGLYNANVSSGKYNGLESYRAWQKNPNYNPGEDKYDRMFRLMGNSHLEIMQDFGGGGYNMFGGYGRALKTVPTFKTLVERMGNTIQDMSGSLEAGWADGETLLIEIHGILRGKNVPSGGTFTKLIQVAEKIAKQNGLKNVRIEFKMIYNGRLKSDPTWAQKYGYYFSEVSENGIPSVHWEKTLTH